MAQKRKFRIYLAGPITGCNEEQKSLWRDEVKSKYGSKLDFCDPVDNLMDDRVAPSRFIEADLQAIENADGLLVNMWQESIGSTIGVIHAHQKGRPVVVANPNHIRSRMLEFYADVMTDTPLKAAKALHDLLSAEANWVVMKSGQREDEPFDRRKLTDALRDACRNAGCDDVMLPRIILPKVIDGLKRTEKKIRRRFPTGTIDEEVKEALLDLAEEHPDASGVAEEWRKHRTGKDGALLRSVAPVTTGAIDVAVTSPKSHGTIWGKGVKKLDDIKSPEAREIFRDIRSVPGVTRIVLGAFSRGEERSRCCASVFQSPTACVIEGKLFDKGTKGTLQTFQVRVQLDAVKTQILQAITEVLRDRDVWAG